MTTFYSVMYDLGGDIFKGYRTGFVSSHLDESIAERVASINSGWVETMQEECHPDFIESMKKTDAQYRADEVRTRVSARSMLANGG